MTDTEPQYVKQSEYARMRGWTPERVGQLKRRGLVQIVAGYVDVAASDQLIENTIRPQVSVKAALGANGHTNGKGSRQTQAASLIEAQARAAEARAQLTELKVRQMEGEVVERAEVVCLLQTAFTEVRTELMQLPERIVTQVRDAADEHTARQIVDRDVRATLMRCADRVRKFVQLDQPGI